MPVQALLVALRAPLARLLPVWYHRCACWALGIRLMTDSSVPGWASIVIPVYFLGGLQMLALGMAFIERPRLLMIDELSLGLAPVIVEQLLPIVRDLAAAGTTIIIVEQSVNLALTIARTAYFMEKGEIRFSGRTADLLDRPDLLRSVFLEGAGGGAANADGSGLPLIEPLVRGSILAHGPENILRFMGRPCCSDGLPRVTFKGQLKSNIKRFETGLRITSLIVGITVGVLSARSILKQGRKK